VESRVQRSGRPGFVEPVDGTDGVRLWWQVTQPPRVSIVVPTAGGRRVVDGEESLLVERCLRSVLARTSYPDWEVVLVTSEHTPPDVVPRLAALLGDRLRVSPVAGPFNFSTSVNEGARHATGPLVLLLNDDTEVVEPRWLERMVAAIQDPAVGAVGAGLLFGDGTIQHVGIVFDDSGAPVHAYGSEVDDRGRLGAKVLDTDWSAVTGACLLTRADVFAEVGGFTEDLPLNYNDVDFCLKLRHRGLDVVCAPFARLYHYESSTRGHVLLDTELAYLDRHWGLRRRLDPHVEFRRSL